MVDVNLNKDRNEKDVTDADARINKVVNKSYYNSKYAKEYYQKNKETILNRSKKRWADMTDFEKQEYYEERKQKRKLKKRGEL